MKSSTTLILKVISRLKFVAASLYYKPLLKRLGYLDRSKALPPLPKSVFYKDEHPLQSLINLHNNFLRESGWLESKNSNQSIINGEFAPWISFSSLNFLKTLNFKESNFLEFGAGSSTYYFSKICSSVRSVEFNKDYIDCMQQSLSDKSNISIFDGSNASFTHSVKDLPPIFFGNLKEAYDYDLRFEVMPDELNYDFMQFSAAVFREISDCDVCFIDGGYRNLQLTLYSLCETKPLLIVDNADFPQLEYGINKLRESGLREIPFSGLGPLNSYSSTTSIFLIQQQGKNQIFLRSLFKSFLI